MYRHSKPAFKAIRAVSPSKIPGQTIMLFCSASNARSLFTAAIGMLFLDRDATSKKEVYRGSIDFRGML